MDLSFLTKYAIPVIVGICLCVGYMIKNLIPGDKLNRFIPCIMGILGLIINLCINQSVSADIVLAGLFSGLASTGLYEAFTHIINKEDE